METENFGVDWCDSCKKETMKIKKNNHLYCDACKHMKW